MKSNLFNTLLVSIFVFGLQACGLKGDLYLEKPAEAQAEDGDKTQKNTSAAEAATESGLEDETDVDEDPLDNNAYFESNPGDADSVGVETDTDTTE